MTATAAAIILLAGLGNGQDPAGRALGYLAREGPSWKSRNGCFSCHNNGDAVRALLLARRSGREVPDEALDESLRWLAAPGDWDRNGGDSPFSDKVLARVAFASALAEAGRTIPKWDRSALRDAASQLARDQLPDGSWQGEGGESIASPASYGAVLATAMATQTLKEADPDGYADAIAAGARWLGEAPVARVTDAAAVSIGLAGAEGPGFAEKRARAIETIRAGQGGDGGWGPYVRSSPEPFDTALAILALAANSPGDADRARIRRGRAFLIAAQRDDGSWRETTRPAGGESYAQRVSTTAWAALALLATEGLEGDRSRTNGN